jgi:hypothetical protein
MFPRNNLKRNEQLKKLSPFAYSVLDTIRYWNIERIAGDIAKMQAHPRNVKVTDLTEIVRAVYKPLFILENLVSEIHIKGCYKLLYKQLFIENPMDAGKYQELVKTTLSAFISIRKDIHYRFYPLLMKLASNKFFTYDCFFSERKNRIMALLNFKESERIAPMDVLVPIKKKPDDDEEQNQEDSSQAADVKEDPEEARKQAAEAAERKTIEKGLHNLETMFPEAGWDKFTDYPDIYPYFRSILDLKKGYELIAPSDPMLQFAILARIVEELLIGLRSVIFVPVESAEHDDHLDEEIGSIINSWHDYIEASVIKEYLSRLNEYCEVLAESSDARNSPFGRRMLDEMFSAKRLFFFPHLHYTTQNATTSSTLQKKGISSLSREVRKLRKYLTIIAEGIEKGMKEGGAEADAVCDWVSNPWKPYVFQVANSISKRLDILLGQKKRTNASLILFTLSVTTVLDYFVNNAGSWAYAPPDEVVFRSINGEGVIPQFGVDERINADAIFKQKIKERLGKA